MDQPTRPSGFEFGDFRVDLLGRRLLLKASGRSLSLSSRAFEILVLFLEHPGDLIDKSTLMAAVWPKVVVDENNLNQHVSALRRALGDRPEEHRFILTVPGRGYRFVAVVHPLTDVPAAPHLVDPRTENPGAPESIVPPPRKQTKEEDSPNLRAGIAATGSDAASSQSLAPPGPPRYAKRVPRTWVGGSLITVALLAASWAIVHYRTAGETAERTDPGSTPATIRALAVLPLDNLSGDKEQEYFADGMTDALTTALAQIGSLRVISRTSAMQFKGSRESLPQIGRDLKVDAVVEGSVTRSENRVRVTAQLIEAGSDRHLWARSYERDLKDVLALQDEIAQDIVEQIRVKLSPKERSLIVAAHTVDPAAYDAYLRGAFWLDQLTPEGLEKACGYFRKALAKDPGYALAYVGIAECFQFHNDPLKAREAIVKALALDPLLSEAHEVLACKKFFFDWDWSGAEAEHKRAIALSPNYAPAHHWYAHELVAMGRLEEAMREIEIARDLDPYSADIANWLGQVLYHARRYDDALRENQLGLEMHPNLGGLYYWEMADIYEQKKMFAEAFGARQQALRLARDPNVTALDEAYKRSGYNGYLLKQAKFAQRRDPAYAAHIYALLNDEPRAVAALEAAYDRHDPAVLFIRSAPELESIRFSPRFRDLVRRIGFPEPSSDKN